MTGFESCVVLKPWGHEFQVFDNGAVSVWMLCIKPGQGTSVHCHFGKTAAFVPIEGEVMVRTNVEARRLRFPEWAAVDRYEFHSVGNPGARDLWLIEIEKPSDKGDLFRLNDSYGRGQGYEGGSNIVREDLGRFGHFTLIEGAEYQEHRRVFFQLGGGSLYIQRLGAERFSQRLYDVRATAAA